MNFTKIRLTKYILILAITIFLSFGSLTQAQPGRTSCPTECSQDCELDIACQNQLLFNKDSKCKPFRCVGSQDVTIDLEGIDLNIFGVNIRFNSERAIQQVVIIGFSLFLGAIALVAVLIGVFAAIKRADTTDASEIAKLNKTMSNAIVGLVIVVVSIAIVQIVASLIGVGNIFSNITFNNLIPDAADFN